jgi:dethiobiotin synthetase
VRPEQLIAVAGTGTDVGKTWVTAAVASALRARGRVVRARKPAQSFDPGDPVDGRDAAVLAAATGESPDDVCPPHRSYEVAMAPPMASDVLGRGRVGLTALLDELTWPADATDVGFVETAGGLRSPIAHDADNADLVRRLGPDLVLLVAPAALGVINDVRLSVGALHPSLDVLVVLNRFDAEDETHRRSADWLTDHDALDVVTAIDELVDRLSPRDGSARGAASPASAAQSSKRARRAAALE